MVAKICGCYKKLKKLSEFNKNKYGKFGLRSKCKDCDHEYHKKWYEENREDKLSKNKEWEINNLEERKKYLSEYNKNWSMKNQDRKNIIRSRYKAKKLKAIPEMSAEEWNKIETIYSKSQKLGTDYQVDHIVPLSKGGLHHPDNLQIIPTIENLKKKDNPDYVVDPKLVIKI